MIFWLVMALLTGAAVLAVLWPLGRVDLSRDEPEDATDAAFYKAQLAEIERDAERGLIDAQDAETARLEAARRLLAATRRGEADSSRDQSRGRRRAVAALALAGIPALSLGLYLSVGHPDLPAQPLAARTDKPVADLSMEEALSRIEAHLEKNPNDGRGFEVVAPVYMATGRYDEAVRAFATAARLLGETPARLENWGEAVVASADGVVTADARSLFDRALAADPKRQKARYYRALAAEQDGNKEEAIRVYSELSDEVPGTPLAADLGRRIAALGGTPPAQATDPAATEAGKAVAALPADQRMGMIRGMVEQLSSRLAKDGSDVEGWLRLVRSYAVLNEPAKARDALERGRAALAGDAQGRERLEALAKDLNIGGS